MRGKFITLEGGEGAGKSTHVRILAKWLDEAGINVVCTREPGGAPGAEAIRRILIEGIAEGFTGKTEVLLHYAARREHLEKTVQPALERGAWVISDRFADSTMAYQGYGLGVDPEWINRVHQLAVGDLRPDLSLILDLSPQEGRGRALSRARAMDRYDGMDLSFHARVRSGFLAIAEANSDRCKVINASAEVEQVSRSICSAVAGKFDLDSPGS